MSRWHQVPRIKGLPRPVKRKGVMNSFEAAWAADLEILKYAGEVLDYKYEHLNFKLAGYKCFYKPDFYVVYHDHFEIHEVKGFVRDDALVKFKVAASMYPHLVWKMCKGKKVKGKIIWEVKAYG